jgi:enediyne biosynthesis protein E7
MITDTVLTVPGPGLEKAAEAGQEFLADTLGYFSRLNAEHGPVFKLPIGTQETVFVNKAELAEQILRLDFEDYAQSAQTEELMRPMLGRSMPVVADHGYWEQMHAIIMPMFTPKMLRRYFEGTVEAVAAEVAHLAELRARGEAVPLLSFVRQGIFTALTRTIFVRGIKPDDVTTLLSWFASSDNYMNVRYLTGLAADGDMSPLVKQGREDVERINKYVYDLIAWRRANPVDEAEDMLDILLQSTKPDGDTLSDIEVRDNVVALFFGGQETTPSVITWAFGLLSANPEKRNIMLEEIDRVLGDRMPTFQDLGELKYTEMVLDEALRLYPPFSFIGRETLRDVELGGFKVPKGTPLGFVGWTIHRDPDHWPEPEAFEPERHTPENKKARAKCAFVAFGYGQRRCIGERVGRMEGLLMLAMVSQKFLLNHVGGGLPLAKVVQSIKPADGMPMAIEAR